VKQEHSELKEQKAKVEVVIGTMADRHDVVVGILDAVRNERDQARTELEAMTVQALDNVEQVELGRVKAIETRKQFREQVNALNEEKYTVTKQLKELSLQMQTGALHLDEVLRQKEELASHVAYLEDQQLTIEDSGDLNNVLEKAEKTQQKATAKVVQLRLDLNVLQSKYDAVKRQKKRAPGEE